MAVAQIELGELFYHGLGVQQSYEDAFSWYYKAAKQSQSYAQNMVGLMLLQGQGVAANPLLAALWIRKAAYQGAKQAQYQLGLLYLNGIGIEQDDVYAYGWLKIALEDQTDVTPTVLVNLVDGMTPESKESTADLVEELKAKYPSMPT